MDLPTSLKHSDIRAMVQHRNVWKKLVTHVGDTRAIHDSSHQKNTHQIGNDITDHNRTRQRNSKPTRDVTVITKSTPTNNHRPSTISGAIHAGPAHTTTMMTIRMCKQLLQVRRHHPTQLPSPLTLGKTTRQLQLLIVNYHGRGATHVIMSNTIVVPKDHRSLKLRKVKSPPGD